MKKGFPRPWNNDLKSPVPYTSESETNLGMGNDVRAEECVNEDLCTACGLKLDDTMCVAVSNQNMVTVSDSGMSHVKCAILAEKYCPEFKNKKIRMVHVQTAPVLEILKKRHDPWIKGESSCHLVALDEILQYRVDQEQVAC